MGLRWLLLIGLAGLLAMNVHYTEAQDLQAPPDRDEFIVSLVGRPTPEDAAMVAAAGGEIIASARRINAVLVTLPRGAVPLLNAHPRVQVIEENIRGFPLQQTVPWGIHRVFDNSTQNRNETWTASCNGQTVRIAVLDTGVDGNHPDLNLAGGVNMNAVPPNDQWQDGYGHGTHVAGTIAALDNAIGVVGASPGVACYAIRAGGWAFVNEEWRWIFPAWQVIEGIGWSVDEGMHILNMSIGFDRHISALEQAVDDAYGAGVLLVASAGNEGSGTDTVVYPAKYASVVAVAASTSGDLRASFSSTGPAVELIAPGVGINSTLMGGEYGTSNGTSMAAPHVAGAAALVWAANPALSNVQLRQLLQNTAEDLSLSANEQGFGMVRPDTAIATFTDGTVTLPAIGWNDISESGEASDTEVSYGILRVHRKDSDVNRTAVSVELAFSGTAVRDVHYFIAETEPPWGPWEAPDPSWVWDIWGPTTPDTVVITACHTDLYVVPIPNSRVDGTRTVIVNVLPSANYLVGTPSQTTFWIIDDDEDALAGIYGWELIEVPDHGGMGGDFGSGVNQWGEVVGWFTPFYTRGFLWEQSAGSTILQPPSWFPGSDWWVSPHAINDDSIAVGHAGYLSGSTYFQRASYWNTPQSSQAILLPDLGFTTSSNYGRNRATGINEAGVIVGMAPIDTATLIAHVVYWAPDSGGNYPDPVTGWAITLGALGGVTEIAESTAVNDQAVVVGRSQTQTSGGAYHAFRSRSSWTGTRFEPEPLFVLWDDMGTETGTDTDTSEANDINNFGELVGRGNVAGSASMRALYKAPSSGKNEGWFDLGVLSGATASNARAINDNGLIVGTSGNRAFVLSNVGAPGSQTMIELLHESWLWDGANSQYVPANSQWTLSSAVSINNENMIVAHGQKAGGAPWRTRTVLLVPLFSPP